MSAHRGASQRAYYGANSSTFHAASDGRLVSCRAADLAKRELPAIGIVAAKLIETLACPGHHQDARSGRDGRARAEHQQRYKG
jgi:hypothetical protein